MDEEENPKLSNSSMNLEYLEPILDLENSDATITEATTSEQITDLKEKFIAALDQLDVRVEKFRKEALVLQDKRNFLLVSMDLIKSNELFGSMEAPVKNDINMYIDLVSNRLATVSINVTTLRDQAQEDSLSYVNSLIDSMLTTGNINVSIEKCQQYLNACSGSQSVIDKKFESAILGCALDDQKDIKKRLAALLGYLNKQTIKHE